MRLRSARDSRDCFLNCATATRKRRTIRQKIEKKIAAGCIRKANFLSLSINYPYYVSYTGSSTETVAFQVNEILKIDYEFLKFFDWDQKYKCPRHHFQYLAQFTNSNFWYPRLWNFLRRGLHNYGFFFIIASTAIDLPLPWSLFDYHFNRIDTQFTEKIQAHYIGMTGIVHLKSIKCFFVYIE